MKSNNPYTFFDQFCLRTPILSLNFYREFLKENHISIDQFRTVWKNDIIREAIFLASPELYSEIDKWLTDPTIANKKSERLASTFLKYITRMSSRCTPFGLFAGCSIGHFDKKTDIELNNISEYSRVTHFDMNFLVAFAQNLSKEETIKNEVLWYTNTSMYRVGNQYRYVEYSYNKKHRREHTIEAITYTPFLEMIITNALTGKKVKDLALLLVSDEITLEDAVAFIDILIDNQILVSEIEPSVTGQDFLLQLERSLSQLNIKKEILNEIRSYQSFLTDIDVRFGNDIQEYETLSKRLDASKRSFENKFLFQTDLYINAQANQLNRSWAYKLKRALPFLNKLTLDTANTTLDQFKNAFLEKYETQEISLPIALDTELGVGYLQYQDAKDSTPFLDDLSIPFKNKKNDSVTWNAFHELLLQKLNTSVEGPSQTLLLTDDDLKIFQENWNDLPNTMSALTEIVSSEEGEKMFVSSVNGASAANLLGRFSTGNTAVYDYVKDITKLEDQYDDNILVEIVHLPESRTGNILRRAHLREYELPYLAKSNLEASKQISVNDLMISVAGGQIILRSKSLNKQVVPRLTNAHNYSVNALPIYQFLCDLQHQNLRSGIGFQWGEILQKKIFLPRVVYKDFILSKARWKLDKEDFESLKVWCICDDFESIKRWRTLKGIPKYVQLVEGDNMLLINFENKNAVAMLLDLVKNKQNFILEEFLYAQDDELKIQESIVKKGDEAFANQVIISFFNEEKLRR